MAAPELPAVVEVGPFRYTVTADELERLRIEHAEARQLSGRTDHDLLRIYVDTTAAAGADTRRDTLLHEVLHCLAFTAGLSAEWGSEKEETVVRRLSPLLLDALRRNPALVAYLLAP